MGKSTLLLQVAGGVALAQGGVLYATGEESAGQIRRRAARLGLASGPACHEAPRRGPTEGAPCASSTAIACLARTSTRPARSWWPGWNWTGWPGRRRRSSPLLPALRLTSARPGLAGHRCAAGRPGGFLSALARGTYFGHVTEHVALELSALAGREVAFGRTVWAGAEGRYDVIMECPQDEPPAVPQDLLTLAMWVVTETSPSARRRCGTPSNRSPGMAAGLLGRAPPPWPRRLASAVSRSGGPEPQPAPPRLRLPPLHCCGRPSPSRPRRRDRPPTRSGQGTAATGVPPAGVVARSKAGAAAALGTLRGPW